MYKCCLCFVHCAAVQSISLTVLTTYQNVFKNRFSQQLSRAAATTMDSSGQTSRDIGGHVSWHNDAKVGGHISAKEESAGIHNHREGRMKTQGVESIKNSWQKRRCTCVHHYDVLEQTSWQDRRNVVLAVWNTWAGFLAKKKTYCFYNVTYLSRFLGKTEDTLLAVWHTWAGFLAKKKTHCFDRLTNLSGFLAKKTRWTCLILCCMLCWLIAMLSKLAHAQQHQQCDVPEQGFLQRSSQRAWERASAWGCAATGLSEWLQGAKQRPPRLSPRSCSKLTTFRATALLWLWKCKVNDAGLSGSFLKSKQMQSNDSSSSSSSSSRPCILTLQL